MASILMFIPDPLHEALRQASKQERRPQYRLVIEALAQYLHSEGQEATPDTGKASKGRV